MKKILFLSYLHGFGGAERQIVLLANAMCKKNYKVTLVSISVDNKKYELDENINYIFLPDRYKNFKRIIGRYLDLKKILKVLKPDITISFWFQSAYFTALMRKSITGKIIYSERGDPGDKEYFGLLGIIRKLTIGRIDGFVFQSNGAMNYFKEKIRKKSVVIPNPVFVKREKYPKVITRRKSIVTVGRLHEQKNQSLLINAFNLIKDEFPDYSLEIYGDGQLKDDLNMQIEQLGLINRVCLMGSFSNIHDKIYNASLFVLSSDFEGLPNTLIEAMALGIPCISTDCKPGGAREIINHMSDGIIVSRNDEKELSEAMAMLLNKRDFAEELGKNAEHNIKRFNPDIIYSRWEKYIEEVSNK